MRNEAASINVTWEVESNGRELWNVTKPTGHRCPWCFASVVSAACHRNRQGVEGRLTWVRMPFLRSKPDWVCLGCVYEIGSACLSLSYESHIDRRNVVHAAQLEGMTEDEFRVAFLTNQAEVLTSRAQGRPLSSDDNLLLTRVCTLLKVTRYLPLTDIQT